MYTRGVGVPKDDRQAIRWFRKEAEHRPGGYHGYLGTELDADFAEEAALKGKAWVQNLLGFHYKNGLGKKQDYMKAVFWFRKAAKQQGEEGSDDAQFNLGYMYSIGLGVPKDLKQSLYWYRKSAEQGHRGAIKYLGLMYDDSMGMLKAAEQGNAQDQNILGDMYLRGNGVPQDYKLAMFWYRKAAEQGYDICLVTHRC